MTLCFSHGKWPAEVKNDVSFKKNQKNLWPLSSLPPISHIADRLQLSFLSKIISIKNIKQQ